MRDPCPCPCHPELDSGSSSFVPSFPSITKIATKSKISRNDFSCHPALDAGSMFLWFPWILSSPNQTLEQALNLFQDLKRKHLQNIEIYATLYLVSVFHTKKYYEYKNKYTIAGKESTGRNANILSSFLTVSIVSSVFCLGF